MSPIGTKSLIRTDLVPSIYPLCNFFIVFSMEGCNLPFSNEQSIKIILVKLGNYKVTYLGNHLLGSM